ncbi:hypothetical protein QBC35DRAFT_535249 [Podospora australis]|uniref:Uncharacterized protein n=1 Tax=Podospora australis TaxID=1536484 RepID=A0AAN6WLL9_9PEZI|nr:hypothetical protein QBC35DRAFT_535249 [Podospora australis]
MATSLLATARPIFGSGGIVLRCKHNSKSPRKRWFTRKSLQPGEPSHFELQWTKLSGFRNRIHLEGLNEILFCSSALPFKAALCYYRLVRLTCGHITDKGYSRAQNPEKVCEYAETMLSRPKLSPSEPDFECRIKDKITLEPEQLKWACPACRKGKPCLKESAPSPPKQEVRFPQVPYAFDHPRPSPSPPPRYRPPPEDYEDYYNPPTRVDSKGHVLFTCVDHLVPDDLFSEAHMERIERGQFFVSKPRGGKQ